MEFVSWRTTWQLLASRRKIEHKELLSGPGGEGAISLWTKLLARHCQYWVITGTRLVTWGKRVGQKGCQSLSSRTYGRVGEAGCWWILLDFAACWNWSRVVVMVDECWWEHLGQLLVRWRRAYWSSLATANWSCPVQWPWTFWVRCSESFHVLWSVYALFFLSSFIKSTHRRFYCKGHLSWNPFCQGKVVVQGKVTIVKEQLDFLRPNPCQPESEPYKRLGKLCKSNKWTGSLATRCSVSFLFTARRKEAKHGTARSFPPCLNLFESCGTGVQAHPMLQAQLDQRSCCCPWAQSFWCIAEFGLQRRRSLSRKWWDFWPCMHVVNQMMQYDMTCMRD